MQPVITNQGLHSPTEHVQPHQNNGHSSHIGLSEAPTSPRQNTFKDERTQRQFFKLKKRLEARQKDTVQLPSIIDHDTSKASGDTPQSSLEAQEKQNAQKEKEKELIELLSSIETPTVSEVGVTSALLKWTSPQGSSEHTYTLLLSYKNKEDKPKTAYEGVDGECCLKDLKPACSYSVCVVAKAKHLCGRPSESVSFETLSCEPEAPPPPKLLSRTKATIFLKWANAVDNGAKITSYILESDEGSHEFVEIFKGLQKQFKAVKLKMGTCYRFRLAAVNEHGQSRYSETSCFSTSGSVPSQPPPPALRDSGVHSLALHWEARPNDDAYTLQMEDPKHGFLPVYNGQELSYLCTGLARNSACTFRLSASNDEGSSHWSTPVTFRTLPDKPARPPRPSLKGKAHSHHLKVAWDPPKDDGGAPVTEYQLEMDDGEGFSSIYSGPECESQADHLKPGTCYLFRVRCTSEGGTSPFSEVGTVTTCAVVPGPCDPPKVKGKPKALSMHLEWSPPEYDGGSPVVDYELEVTHPDGSSRLAYRGGNPDCAVAGLGPGQLYQYRVRAYNTVGASGWSEAAEVMSGAGAPDAPKEVRAVPRSPHIVFVTWSEPAHNGAAITEYRVESKREENPFEAVHSGPSCQAEVKSLLPATLYAYRVQAANASGWGPFSEGVECETPPSSPAAVLTASVKSEVGANQLRLSWKPPVDHGSPIVGYNVEVGDVLHTVGAPEILVEGLAPETCYKVRIQAVNAVGPGPFSSSTKLSTRGLPPPPPSLECAGASHNGLRLKWGDGKNAGLKTYALEMEQTKRFVTLYQGTAQSHKVSKLHELTTYHFRIRASNDEGDGPYSKTYAFATQRALPPPPKAPKVSEVTETSCVVEWQPIKPIGDDMLSYKLQLGTRESDFHVLYTGMQTQFTAQSLAPGCEYSVRVSGVRHCEDGHQAGPFSPCTAFATNEVAKPAKLVTAERQPLSDQQWALIILCGFTCFAVCVAILLERILSS